MPIAALLELSLHSKNEEEAKAEKGKMESVLGENSNKLGLRSRFGITWPTRGLRGMDTYRPPSGMIVDEDISDDDGNENQLHPQPTEYQRENAHPLFREDDLAPGPRRGITWPPAHEERFYEVPSLDFRSDDGIDENWDSERAIRMEKLRLAFQRKRLRRRLFNGG